MAFASLSLLLKNLPVENLHCALKLLRNGAARMQCEEYLKLHRASKHFVPAGACLTRRGKFTLFLSSFILQH
jgi:hypothetical protein